jgi:hypothetical protein
MCSVRTHRRALSYKTHAEERKVRVLAAAQEQRLFMSNPGTLRERKLRSAQREARKGNIQAHPPDTKLPEL